MKTPLVAVAAMLGAMAAVPATAQFYGGFSVGKSDFNPAREDWTAGAPFVTTFDDTDTAWKLFGGYQFNRHVGIEIAYTYLGEYNATNMLAGVDTGLATVKVNSWAAFMTGTLPVAEKFSLTGKLGLSHNRSKMTFNSSGVAFLPFDSGSDTKTDFAWGLGASYWLSKTMAIRVEYEDFGRSGESNGAFTIPGKTGRSEPRLVSAGLQVSF